MYLISLTSFWRGYCWNIKWFWIWTYLDLFWPFCGINPIYQTLTPWNPSLLVSETYFHNSLSSLFWPSRFHVLILFSWFQVLPGYWCPNPSAGFTHGLVLSLPGQWRSPFGCPSLVFGWHSLLRPFLLIPIFLPARFLLPLIRIILFFSVVHCGMLETS